MAYSSFEKQREAMRRYAQTPAGREAKRRSRERFLAKQKAMRESSQLTIDAKPLADAIKGWMQ